MFHCTRVKERRMNERIRWLSVVGKVYTGILLDRVHRITGDSIDEEQNMEGVYRLDLYPKTDR